MNRITYTIVHYYKTSQPLRAILFIPLWLIKVLSGWRTRTRLRHYTKIVKGGNLIISPRNFPGQFKVNATSDLAIRSIRDGVFEPDLTTLLERFSGIDGDIANIGSNIGFYSVFFAKRFPNIGKVFAIEPNPEAIDLLKWNISNNDVEDRVDLLQVCIGKEAGQVEFAYVPGKSEYSSIGNIVHPNVDGLIQRHMTIDVQPLSVAMSGQVSGLSLIFADTEGAEFLVFKGAEDVIRQSKPLLVFECEDELLRSFGHSSQMLGSYITDLGYEVRDAAVPDQCPIYPFTGAVIAVPIGRKDWLKILQDSPAI